MPASSSKGKTTKSTSKNGSAKSKAPIKKDPANTLFWVGIGASAGGLEALKGFVKHLPESIDATYIVAQHLSSSHKSMLVELIARETSLTVVSLKDGTIPKPNVIYITPPSKNIIVEDGILRLTTPDPSRVGPVPSVNQFFNTLAEQRSNRAIGIILSGTGSDGSEGTREIRAAGGITICQDEDSAKYNGMPGSAVETGAVDLVLPPEKMGEQLLHITQHPGDSIQIIEEEEPSEYFELLKLLKVHQGVDFKNYKPNTIQRRIQRRLTAINISSLTKYIQHCKANRKELELLYKDLLISVTSFFRDDYAFQAIPPVLKGIAGRANELDDSIRIWVAGCATGEEAYSLAIQLAEEIGGTPRFSDYKFQIFATDIDSDALAFARRGVYSDVSLSHVSDELKSKYFNYDGSGQYEVIKPLRERVLFAQHNVFEDPPFLRLDLISCRNLLIYFNQNLQKRVLNLFHYALKPTGNLFLGKSESSNLTAELFQCVQQQAKIYKRKLSATAEIRPFASLSPVGKGGKSTTAGAAAPSPAEANRLLLAESLLSAIARDGLLVGETLDIKKAYGNLQPFLQLEPGDVRPNISNMIKSELRQEIKALVFKANRETKRISSFLSKEIWHDQKKLKVQLHITPITLPETTEQLFFIQFDSKKPLDETLDELPEDIKNTEALARIKILEQELALSQTHLQTVIEELETSNEELQSTNEELQSTNEELQSTNEELETSNEELQSTNEEITTVNEELHFKSSELLAINEDMNNIKNSITYPLVVLDSLLRVTQFNHNASDIFDFSGIKSAIITSVPTKLDIKHFRDHITTVMEKGTLYTEQLATDDKTYLMTIQPYRSQQNIDGVIITFVDNTDEQTVTHELQKLSAQYKLIMDSAGEGIYGLDTDGNVTFANQAAVDMLGYTTNELMGKNQHTLIHHTKPDGTPYPQQECPIYKAIQDKAVHHVDNEVFWHKDGTSFPVEYISTPIIEDSDCTGAVITFKDITARKEADALLQAQKHDFEMILNSVPSFIFYKDAHNKILRLNEAAAKSMGGTVKDFEGMQTEDLFPSMAEKYLKDDQQVISSGKAIHGILEQYKPTDGEERWIQTDKVPQPDKDGTPYGLVAISTDVTQLKEVETRLAESEERLKLAVKGSQDGLWDWDINTNAVYLAPQYKHLIGYKDTELDNSYDEWFNRIHPDDVDGAMLQLQAHLTSKEPYNAEFRLKTKSGHYRWFNSIGEALFDDNGKAYRMAGSIRDITDRVEAQQRLKESNQDLEHFASIAAHDLQEPLLKMRVYSTELLEDYKEKLDDNGKKYLNRISESTDRLQSLINSLLSYSRVSTKQTLPEKINLVDVVTNVTEDLGAKIEAAQATVQIDDTLPNVFVDRNQLYQLFQNLISNAVKFRKEDTPPVIEIYPTDKKSPPGQTTIAIKDNGIGFKQQYADRIFDVFERLHTLNEYSGTGIGLAVCKKIIAQHNGSITVTSKENEGTTFWVTLPTPYQKTS